MTKKDIQEEYEQTINELMGWAVAGLFIFPIICGFVAKGKMCKVDEEWEWDTKDLWKHKLINWEFGIAIVKVVFITIYLCIVFANGFTN